MYMVEYNYETTIILLGELAEFEDMVSFFPRMHPARIQAISNAADISKYARGSKFYSFVSHR